MRLRSLTLSTLCLLLAACGADEATSLVERYASRTGNAIEVDVNLSLRSAAQLYPALAPRRERLAPVAEIREGLLELLDLRHCNLVQLVSERNSSLGRVAKPSQRLLYELQILPELNRCIESLHHNDDKQVLRRKLQGYAAIKRQNFPPLLFNAIYNSDEMEQHFSFGQPALIPGETGYLAPLTETLQRFALLADLSGQSVWQTPRFTNELETSYEALYRADFGARWISSMALLTQTLEQTARALEDRLSGRPICFNRKRNNQSDILWSVFVKFYVGELQPYIAHVEREGREWSRLNLEILEPLRQTPQSQLIIPYFEQTADSPIWGPYLEARQRHTEGWQLLLEQCGLRPGT